MEIEKRLYEDIKEYCRMNGLKVGKYINSLLRKAFTADVYGEAPGFVRESEPAEEDEGKGPLEAEGKVPEPEEDIYGDPAPYRPNRKKRRLE